MSEEELDLVNLEFEHRHMIIGIEEREYHKGYLEHI